MTAQSEYPRLILREGWGEREEFEIEQKGWFTADVEVENGQRYTFNFYDPGRLGQELQDYEQMGEPCFYELNLVVVPRVTIEAIRECIGFLWRKGSFDDLKADAAEGE